MTREQILDHKGAFLLGRHV